MEPSAPVQPPDLRNLRLDVLRRAVELYLGIAYPSGEPPAAVRRRLEWNTAGDAQEILAQPPFERSTRPDAGKTAIFALRLGNHRYPHMKLQVQPWPNAEGFLLSINTHDQVQALDPNAADMAAFREIQDSNQQLKESIESAWDGAGLPTFLRFLRDYIENRESEQARGKSEPPPRG
jgi:hypothetical protein